MIENGADPLAKNCDGYSFIDAAIMNDNYELLECLLFNNPLKPDARRRFGPLHLAATKPDSKCLSYLLNSHDPNEVISVIDLASPLHFAVLTN